MEVGVPTGGGSARRSTVHGERRGGLLSPSLDGQRAGSVAGAWAAKKGEGSPAGAPPRGHQAKAGDTSRPVSSFCSGRATTRSGDSPGGGGRDGYWDGICGGAGGGLRDGGPGVVPGAVKVGMEDGRPGGGVGVLERCVCVGEPRRA